MTTGTVSPALTSTPKFGGMLAFGVSLFGFACACPILLLYGVNLRLSDVACLLSVAALAAALVRRPALHRSAAVLGLFLVLSFGWIAAEAYYPLFMDSDPPSKMVLVRWLIAFPAAYWLCVATDSPTLRRLVLLGLISGWLADTVLLSYDYFSFTVGGRPAFGTPISHVFWVSGKYRAGGLFGGPNGAAIASLYIVPFLIGYAYECGGRGALVGALGWIATGLVFYLTRSRGATMAAVGMLTWWMLSNRPLRVFLTAILVLLGFLLLFALRPELLDAAMGQDEVVNLLSRFTDSSSIGENSEGRIETAIGSLTLAFTHPLGMGSAYGPALDALTGFAATHNALLQLAVLGGVPLCLTCTGVLLLGASRSFRRPARTEDLVALYVLIVSMFEAHLFNPMTSIILLWLLARLSLQIFPAVNLSEPNIPLKARTSN